VQVNCSEDEVKVQPRTGTKQNNNKFVQTEIRIKFHKLLKQKSGSDNGSGSNSTDGFSATK